MRAKHKKSFRYVPEEIVHNVLPRLPDNSLLRFRCVSKQWRRLISRVKITMQKVTVTNMPFKTIDQTGKVTKIDNRWLNKPSSNVSLLGTWEGVLLVRVDDDLFLWDPSKAPRHVLSISQLETLIQPRLNSGVVIASGLCFDKVKSELKAVMAFPLIDNNDNKVVVMVGLESKITAVIDFPYEFVAFKTRPCRYYSLKSGPVVNDKFHWFIHKSQSSSQQHMLSFNPNADVMFADLPLPEGNFRILGHGVLDGCLSIARRHKYVLGGCPIDVIQMREYGVKQSWAILFRMHRGFDYYKDLVPLFYTKNKDEVLLKGMGGIFTFNTEYQTHKDICVTGLRYDTAVVYESSLDQD